MDNLGERLFELRKSKNLSQEDVADKLGVTRQSVSKWETNQSTPDFDKIVPLCELFEITTDELLKGESKKIEPERKEEKVLTKEDVRKKSAEVVSTFIFICVLAISLFLVAIEVLKINEIIAVALFLCVCGLATARLVKHFMSVPKFEKTKEEKVEKEIEDTVNGILWCIITVIYFALSFTTMAWHITWIVFIIGAVITEIIKLLFMLKKEKKGENKNEQ